ncbi:MAG: alpha/beta hydrolase [Nitrososphaeraceae archaeon]|nr:alpha/beta hydrolase [Nitrososphaeraceae archaeon]
MVILGSITLVSAQTTANATYTPLVSTRANFDTSTSLLLPNHSKTDYAATDVPGLQVGKCPAEIVIYVHGLGATQIDATEQTERVKMSLNNNSYYNPVIGFSWDSNTPKGASTDAALIAKQQGPKLAHFILDFKNECPDSKVRMIGHSMGARVILSTLASLHKNTEWKSENFKLASVHLLGAGVASLWNVYGIKSPVRNIIEQVVIKFYNYFDPKDKVLSGTYPRVELHTALGNTRAQKRISLPSNYIQRDVQNDILPLCDADADGKPDLGLTSKDCNAMERGFNHMGYMGFRDPTTKKLMDDGVMNLVVSDWKNE